MSPEREYTMPIVRSVAARLLSSPVRWSIASARNWWSSARDESPSASCTKLIARSVLAMALSSRASNATSASA